MIYFSWKALSVHVMASMNGPDALPVTYDTFWTFFMSKEISFTTLYGVICDFVAGKSLKSKVHRTLIIFIMLFVMAWPTLASAMTGYDTTTSAFVKTRDGRLVPFAYFMPILYMIHDGQRVGLSNDYLVPYCGLYYSSGKVNY